MRQVSWADGTPIVVFVLPSQHPVHQKFSKQVLRIFPYQLDRMWNKLTFSGLGLGPEVVDSESMLIQKISITHGAIGYVENVKEVDDVSIITIKE